MTCQLVCCKVFYPYLNTEIRNEKLEKPPSLIFLISASSLPLLIYLSKPFPQPVAYNIQHKGYHEKAHACCKYCFVFYGACGSIAKAYLYNIGSYCLKRNKRV